MKEKNVVDLIISFYKLCLINIVEPVPVWRGLINLSDIVMICSVPKLGKSIIARNIAYQISTGGVLVGRECTKKKVLYIALEEKPSVVKNQLLQMGLSDQSEDFYLSFSRSSNILKDVEEAHLNQGIQVVIIDTFIKGFTIKDINSYTETSSIFQGIQNLRHKYGLTFILIHHIGKKKTEDGGSNFLGSTGIFASVDNLISLRKRDQKILLSSSPKADTPITDLHIPIDFETFSVQEGETESFSISNRYEADIKKFLLLKPNSSRKEILSSVTGKSSRLGDTLKKLVLSKEVLEIQVDGNKSYKVPNSLPIGEEPGNREQLQNTEAEDVATTKEAANV